MTETSTLRRVVGALLAMVVGVLLWPAGLVGAAVEVSDTGAPVESTEPPEATDPPEETDGPATSESVDAPADSGAATGEDEDSDGTVALIALVGFVVLLVIASWWMVRRGDPDAQARPSTPDPDAAPGSDML